MTPLVLSRATGRISRLADDQAQAVIARGEGVPMQAVKFLVPNVGPYMLGEVATFSDLDAARLIALGYAEPVPMEDDAPVQAVEGKELEQPPAHRMIHRAPVTKGVQP